MTPTEAPSSKKAFWTPIQTIVLTVTTYLSSQVIASFIILTLPLVLGWTSNDIQLWLKTATGQFLFILLIESTVLLIIWGLLRFKKANFTDIGLAWPKLKDVGFAVAGFGVYFLLYLIITIIVKAIFPDVNFSQNQKIGFESAQQSWELVLVFISLVILPPIVEEILARGFLYTGLKTKLSLWPSVIITSAMFALAHLQFGSGAPLLWVAAIDTFSLSLVLIYLREKTGNLGASIFLHMLKNGIAFVLLFVIQVG